MSGEMSRKGGWNAPFGMGSQNRFANFASISGSARLSLHYVVLNIGLFR